MADTQMGALIRLSDFDSDGRRRGIALQYNPEELHRSITIRTGAPPTESISCVVVFDATDRRSDSDGDDVSSTLDALEIMATPQPRPGPTGFLRRLFGAPLIPKPPMILFVYGESRSIAVRMKRIDITEELHDPALRVLRARLKLTMEVVSSDEWDEDHPQASLLASIESAKRLRANAVFDRFPRNVT